MADEDVIDNPDVEESIDGAKAENGTDDTKTLLEEPGDKAVATPAEWPEDWRAKLAGDDEKGLKKLERFKAPSDVFKSYAELEKKLSAGEQKQPLADDASEEQVAEWREANGIPEKPEGYLDALDGLVIGEEDKEGVDSFLASAHAKNADPAFVTSALEWYNTMKEEQAAQLVAEDKETAMETAESLRGKWGNEYNINFKSIKNFVEGLPDGLGDNLMGARLADGTKFGDNAGALEWLASVANEANPAGFIAPGESATQVEGVREEIATIEKFMRTNRADYNKDTKMQERYRKLLAAEEKLAS